MPLVAGSAARRPRARSLGRSARSHPRTERRSRPACTRFPPVAQGTGPRGAGSTHPPSGNGRSPGPALTLPAPHLIHPNTRRTKRGREKKQIGNHSPPGPVVAGDPIKPLLLDLELLVDGCGRAAGRALTQGGLRQLAVIGLLPAGEDIRQVETPRTIIQLQEAAPAGRR